jgi:UDP-glucuronate 4-epimerase
MRDRVVVTGCAGFIGYWLCDRLLREEYDVIGIDNINDYYDMNLKQDRLKNLRRHKRFLFEYGDVANTDQIEYFFSLYHPDIICHLAAYAGIPYSVSNPGAYERANSLGFFNIIDAARSLTLKNFVYASSSSVYSDDLPGPWSETMKLTLPTNMYSATKRYNELVAAVFSKIYFLPCTGLRFFTVYGPMGRPDMSIWLWTDAIYKNRELTINNRGEMWRDYTYITDIIDGVMAAIKTPQPYAIYNLGRGETVKIDDVVTLIEKYTGRKAKKNYVDLPAGETVHTFSDTSSAQKDLKYNPTVSISEGVKHFIDWYKSYYKVG